MKTNLVLKFTLLLTCSFYLSCEKENSLSNTRLDSSIEERSRNDIYYNFNEEKKTILGEIKENPFSIENLTLAAQTLCIDTNRISINPTDHQIKFSPENYNQILQLTADTSFILYEYNLNTEIIEQGTYYNSYDTIGEIHDYYSIISIDKEIPNIPHEIIESYDYLLKDPIILAQSFLMTGNQELIYEYIDFNDINVDSIRACNLTIPTKPDSMSCECDYYLLPVLLSESEILYDWVCPCDDPAIEDCRFPCELVFVETDHSVFPPVHVWDCDCPNVGTGGDPVSLNECGCPTFGSERNPAGCVDVRNTTSNSFEGVDEVMVIVRKALKSPKKAMTNQNGCWRINESYVGKINVDIKFINSECIIRRGIVNPLIVNHNVGEFWGPDYTNIEVQYQVPDENGDFIQKYWVAASNINLLKLFKIRTPDLSPIPNSLDIALFPSRFGAAPMKSVLLPDFCPDLILGKRQLSTWEVQTLLFHELTHASHFVQNGAEWWNFVVAQEIDNIAVSTQNITDNFGIGIFDFGTDPWGDGSELLGQLVGLVEGFAEHVAWGESAINLEIQVLWDDDWVPVGIFNDLEDGIGFELATGINDNVSGYTRGELFSLMDMNVINYELYLSNLITNLPQGNNPEDVTELFEQYNMQ